MDPAVSIVADGDGKLSGRRTRVELRLVREAAPEPFARVLTTPADCVAMIRDHASLDREALVAVYLDSKLRILGYQRVSVGTLDASMVHPREVFKAAVLLNASAVVVAHNHPSGDATPSQEDLAVTQRLRVAGEILGIDLLDHLILGDGVTWSCAKGGLIDP